MQIIRFRPLQLIAIASICFCSCNKWDPNKQFENDIMSQNHKSLVLEERSNEMRQLEVEAFIQNLNLQLGTSKRFLEWTKQNDIPFSIITTVEMNEQYWENREYDFIDLITTQYGFESEIANFYRRNTDFKPSKLSIITNGIKIINPIMY